MKRILVIIALFLLVQSFLVELFSQIDLTPTSVSVTPTSVQGGRTITVNYVIRNSGTGSSPSFRVGFYWSTSQYSPDNYIDYATESTLAANSSTPTRSKTLTIPSTITTGTYYLVVYTDYNLAITETNENNNTNSALLNITQFRVNSVTVTVTPTTLATISSPITTSGTITGTGSGAVNYRWQWLRPGNSTWEDMTGLTETATMTNGSATISASTYNPFTVGGTYYLRVLTSSPNTISSNQVRVNVPIQTIDLSTTSVSVSPTSIQGGRTINVNYIIRNSGTGSSPSFRVGFYWSTSQYSPDNYIDYASESTLAANSSTPTRTKTLTIPSTIATGTYYLVVYTDYNGSVTETNENNNTNSALLNITQFRVNSVTVTVTPTTLATVSSPITTSGTITGTGSGAVNYRWQWLRPGSSTWEDMTGLTETATMTNGSATISASTYNPFTVGGTYYLRVQTSSPNAVSSNQVTVNVPIPTIDLSTTSVGVSPTSIQGGRTINVNYILRNSGTGSSPSFRVGFYWSTTQYSPDNFLDYADEPILAANSSTPTRTKTLTIPSTIATGTYYLVVYADYNGAVTETNENNNTNSALLNITQFRVNSVTVTVTPTTLATVSSPITTSGTITGTGSGAINYRWQWLRPGSSTWDDMTGLTETATMTIGSATISASTYNPFTVGGTYYLRVQTSSPNAVSSNQVTVNVPIPTIDLSTTSVSVSPDPVQAGNTLTVNYVIHNSGTTFAPAFRLGFYWSTTQYSPDNFLDYADEPILAANTSTPTRTKTITIPSTIATGSYYLVVYADYNGNVTETNENNNTNGASLSITQFRVNSVTADLTPTTLNSGELITRSGVITGTGDGPITYHWEWTIPGSSSWTVGYDKSTYMSNGEVDIQSEQVNATLKGTSSYRLVVTSPNNSVSNEEKVSVLGDTKLVVPYHYQGNTLWCAAAATSMLLSYYGTNVKPKDIAAYFNTDPRVGFGGIINTGIREYIQSFGFTPEITTWWRTSIFTDPTPLDEYIKIALANDHPLFLGVYDQKHAIVITGVDNNGIYVHDPSGAILVDELGREANIDNLIGAYVTWNELHSLYGFWQGSNNEFVTIQILENKTSDKSGLVFDILTADYSDTYMPPESIIFNSHSSFFFTNYINSSPSFYSLTWDGTQKNGYFVYPSNNIFGSDSEHSVKDPDYGVVVDADDQLEIGMLTINSELSSRPIKIWCKIDEVNSSGELIRSIQTFPEKDITMNPQSSKNVYFFSPYQINQLYPNINTLKQLSFLDDNTSTFQYVKFSFYISLNSQIVDHISYIICANSQNQPLASPTTNLVQPTCIQSTGIIEIVSPKEIGMTYSIDGITYTNTSGVFNSVSPGTYTVTARSAAGYVSSGAIVTILTQPSAPSTPQTIPTQPTCYVATGTITVTSPTGSGMTYSIDGSNYTNTSGVFNSVSPGTYTVTARNSAECVSSGDIVTILAQPSAPPALQTTLTQPTCSIATGTITVTSPTGSGMTYSIDGSTYTNTSGVFNSVSPGTYTVTARSSAGCVSSGSIVTITDQPSAPSAPQTTLTQPTCSVATGTITVTSPTGSGMTYSIDGSTYTNTSGVFNSVSPGTYTVTAGNSAGCISSGTIVTITTQPETPVIANHTASIVSTGTFTVTPAGVPSGTTYTWTAPIYTGGVTGGSAQANPQTSISGTLTGTGTAVYTVVPVSGSCTGTSFTVTVTVTTDCVPVTISSHTSNTSMCSVFGEASFTVVANGTSPFTYQWQYNNGGTWVSVSNGLPAGASYTNGGTATLGVTGITSAGSYQYRCYITNCSSGNATSEAATLIVNGSPSAPTVGQITQPTCTVGTGSVVLNGLPSGTWRLVSNPAVVDITGTGISYTVTGLAPGTYVFTVIDSNECGSLTPLIVTINAQPSTPVVANQTASIVSSGTFTVTPSGVPVGTTYTWTTPVYTGGVTGGSSQASPQTSISGTLTGTGTAVYTVIPVSGTCTGTSFTVTVTVTSTCAPVTIGTQPSSTGMCSVFGEASFTVVANGTSPFTYQWQYNNGGTWVSVSNGVPAGASYTNGATATLGVTGITSAGSYQYRCYITNCTSGNMTSAAATLTVNASPAAPTVGQVTQPSCTIGTGSVVLNGLPLGTWRLVSNPAVVDITGTGISYTVTGLAPGTYVFTVIDSNECGSLTPLIVTINAQPSTPVVANQTASIVSSGTFTVTPSGVPVGTTYTWTTPVYTGGVTGGSSQASPQTSISGTLTGTGTAVYTVIPVSGTCTGTSFTVTVTVTSTCAPVTIGTQPSSTGMCSVFGEASFTVVANGTSPFTYQWQYNNGGTWVSVANGIPAGASYTNGSTATLGVTGITTAGSYQYRCYITNCTSGNTTSAGATLTVNASPSAPTVGQITQPGCTVGTGSVVLNGLPSGTWRLVSNPAVIDITGTGSSYTVTGLAPGTYVFGCSNTLGCTSSSSENVIIFPNASMPATPSIGTITQPTCSIPDGSVILQGLPSLGSWTITQTPGAATIIGNGDNKTISGLKPGTYSFTVTNSLGCTSGRSDNVTINAVKVGVIPKITVKYEDLLITYNLGDSLVSYQWFSGPNPIPNATLQYYQTTNRPGTYTVVTVDINGCTNTSNSITIAGIKSLSAYPNPASESFTLKMLNYTEGKAIIKIFNSNGLNVVEFKVDDIDDEILKRIPVNDLKEGVYLIQVLLDNREVYYSKIVVAK